MGCLKELPSCPVDGCSDYTDRGVSGIVLLLIVLAILVFGFACYDLSLILSRSISMIVDSVMLQRASSVNLATTAKDITLQVLLSPELPTGFSGIELGTFEHNTAAAVQTFEDYRSGAALTTTIHGCDDEATCTGRILAPALDNANCTSRNWPITQEMLRRCVN
jgi:hypothetical protein